MLESGKFDMGLSALSPFPDEERNTELPTALKFFQEVYTTDLYEGADYIWRARPAEDVLEMLSDGVSSQVETPSQVQTLRNIEQLATDEHERLKTFGVQFNGEFIVHDVNDVPCLVSAVPKILIHTAETPEQLFHSDEEWGEYARSFIKLHKSLLSYFDASLSRGLPLLYDDAKREQYVYGDSDSGTKDFVLVDADMIYGNDDENYKKFIHDGKTSVEDLLSFVKEYRPAAMTGEITRDFKELVVRYEERGRQLGEEETN